MNNLDTQIATSNTKLTTLKSQINSESVLHTKACTVKNYSEISLWHGCAQHAADNYALDHFGEGDGAFERWFAEYARCNSQTEQSKSVLVRGVVCTDPSAAPAAAAPVPVTN